MKDSTRLFVKKLKDAICFPFLLARDVYRCFSAKRKIIQIYRQTHGLYVDYLAIKRLYFVGGYMKNKECIEKGREGLKEGSLTLLVKAGILETFWADYLTERDVTLIHSLYGILEEISKFAE